MEEDTGQKSPFYYLKLHFRGILLIGCTLLLCLLFIRKDKEEDSKETRSYFVIAIMMSYWFFLLLPIPTTCFMTLVFLPFLQLGNQELSLSFLCEENMVNITSMFICCGFEASKLNKRIAYCLLRLTGSSIIIIHISLVLISAFCSLWFSYIYVCNIMISIAAAIIEELNSQNLIEIENPNRQEIEYNISSKIPTCFYLSIAYACQQAATSNLFGMDYHVFARYNITTGIEMHLGNRNIQKFISYELWLAYGICSLIFLLIGMILIMNFVFLGFCRPNSIDNSKVKRSKDEIKQSKEEYKQKQSEMEKMSFQEWSILIFNLIAIFFMIIRIPFISTAPCFSGEEHKPYMGDSFIIVTTVFILCALPENLNFLYYCNKDKRPTDKSKPCLPWALINKNTAWHVLFIVGGSYAFADGLRESSGFIDFAHEKINDIFENTSVEVVILLTILYCSAFGHIFPNKAVNDLLLMKIIQKCFYEKKGNYILYTIPAIISSSYSFIFVATSPVISVTYIRGKLSIFDVMFAGVFVYIWSILVLFGAWLIFAHAADYYEVPKYERIPTY